MRWDPDKQLCKGKYSLQIPHSNNKVLSHQRFFHRNLREGVAAYLQCPLECPPFLLTLTLWVESSNELSTMRRD